MFLNDHSHISDSKFIELIKLFLSIDELDLYICDKLNNNSIDYFY